MAAQKASSLTGGLSSEKETPISGLVDVGPQFPLPDRGPTR